MSEYDIGAANQRQSDFLWGWNDAEDRKPMKSNPNDDYLRGYAAGRPKPKQRTESMRNVKLHTIRTADGQWTATLDHYEPGDPIGRAESEADAVYDLFIQINEMEADEEQYYAEMDATASKENAS